MIYNKIADDTYHPFYCIVNVNIEMSPNFGELC